MSQGAIPMSAGGGGAAVRTKIDAALARLQTRASGTSRPSDIAAGEVWIETDNPGAGAWSVWEYDGSQDVLKHLLDTTSHKITFPSSQLDNLLGSTKGMLAKRGASAWAGLAVGSALHGLHVNAAGDDLEWRRNGWEKIADDAVPTSASTVDFTGITSGVKHLMVSFNLRPATNDVGLRVRFSQSASFVTSANHYVAQRYAVCQTNSGGFDANAGGTSFYTNGHIYNTSGGAGGVRGTILIEDIQAADCKRAQVQFCYNNTGDGNFYANQGSWLLNVAGALDGLRFYFDSGNIADGRISLFGMRS